MLLRRLPAERGYAMPGYYAAMLPYYIKELLRHLLPPAIFRKAQYYAATTLTYVSLLSRADAT